MKQICLCRLVGLCSSKCISSWNSRVSEVGEGVFHRARMGFSDRGKISGFFYWGNFLGFAMGVLGRIRPGFASFLGRIQDQDLRTDRRDLAPWLTITEHQACYMTGSDLLEDEPGLAMGVTEVKPKEFVQTEAGKEAWARELREMTARRLDFDKPVPEHLKKAAMEGEIHAGGLFFRWRWLQSWRPRVGGKVSCRHGAVGKGDERDWGRI